MYASPTSYARSIAMPVLGGAAAETLLLYLCSVKGNSPTNTSGF